MTIHDTLDPLIGERLDPGVFQLPVHDIRIGYRSAVYFNRAQAIMLAEKPHGGVMMQVFQRGNAVVCGIDEAIAVLKLCAGHYADRQTAAQLFKLFITRRQMVREITASQYRPGHHDWSNEFAQENAYRDSLMEMARYETDLEKHWVSGWDKLVVTALRDGDTVDPWEPVLQIIGPYSEFAHLESVYLGILARQTRIATNTFRVTTAAGDKPVLFFADRFDHYATQGGDGYAAKIGGAKGFASAAMMSWWGDEASGTMPHALIAAYNGDVVEATRAFHSTYPGVPLIALVDFNNDCVTDSLRCLAAFGEKLWGVRLDTSGTMMDRCIVPDGESSPLGVCVQLVRKVREQLDERGGQHVKIVVSGGFTAEKISAFEAASVPVDSYAVGSSLLDGKTDFTADVVSPTVKQGRRQRDSNRLTVVK